MKKLLSMILILTFVLSTITVAFAAIEPIKATKTSSTVLVDGIEVQFEAYNINGNNYFKLRDLASALNGSNKQFDVTWDGTKNAINLITGKDYTVVGEELKANNSDNLKVTDTNSKIYVNGNGVSMKAYNINGNNYFKLRDLGEFTGFNVDWDSVNNKILIDTKTVVVKAPYTFSQTKLDYPYNIYIEGKGYMNFGTAKPFMENGALYLPIKHLAYLGNCYDYTFEPETNSVILSNDFTEKDLYEGKTVREVMEPLVKYNNGYKELWESDGGSVFYRDRYESILNINSSIRTIRDHTKLSDWGLEFLKDGGLFIIQRPGTFYFSLDEGGWEHGGGVNEWIKRLNNMSDSFDCEYKVILKNGEPYWERSTLNAMVGTTMLMDEVEKTLYYGTDEYIAKKLQEMEKTLKMDDSFNNGKTYMETIDDIFKDVPVYVPPKR
jgi:hypothetical protein